MTPPFASITDYLAAQGFTPFAFQETAWQRTEAGQHQLIQCPTGSGKTLAATGATLNTLMRRETTEGPVLLYITPLRAMTRDIEIALSAPLVGTKHRVVARNGDSTSAERAALFRKPPAVILTTPESLSVLLASVRAKALFAHLATVVVDEWHDLLRSKRGTQTQLCLARLRRLAPTLTVVGVSATLADPEAALHALLAPGETGHLTRSDIARDLTLEILESDSRSRIPWAGHLGLSLLRPLATKLVAGETTVVFTNTRNQAEQWFQALKIVRSDLQIELHHGSLARDARTVVEAGLKDGSLDVVVATSALDLGVDYQAVEHIIQIGSARTVSRLVQRAGRARHRPGTVGHVLLVPTNRMHLHEYAALARALDQEQLEPICAPVAPMDVLMQHLVTLALQAPWQADAIYAEITATDAYRGLDRTTFDALLKTLHRGSDSLTEYPEFQRLIQDATDAWMVADRRTAARHRMSIGTIVSHTQVRVKMRRGAALGVVEEQFAGRLRPGEVFRFAGRVLQVLTLRDGELLVKPGRAVKATEVPRWTGGRLPLSDTLAAAVVELMGSGHGLSARIKNASWLTEALRQTESVQQRYSACPSPDRLLVERYQSRDGHHLFVYPFAGWLVHQTLAPILAYRLTQWLPTTLTLTVNDYGIELLADDPEPLDVLLSRWSEALKLADLREDLERAINLSELIKREFRSTARIAGWIFEGYPGRQKSARALQTSAGLLFDVLRQYDPDHLLLQQAENDVLTETCDYARLIQTCECLARIPTDCHTLKEPSPLALPLLIERLEARLSSDTLATRLERLTRGFDG